MLVLLPFEPADDAALISWLPTPEALRWFTGPMLTFPLDSAQLDLVRELADSRAWTAVDGSGDRVGHIELILSAPTVARLVRVIIAPHYRGQGLGSELVGTAVAEARALGATVLTLNVVAENATAISLYSSLGFEHSGEHPDRPEMRTMTRSL